MPETPTDADLDKLRADNEKKRQQIADAESLRATREAEAARAIEYGQLMAENVRLEATLNAAQEAAKVGAVKEGASSALDAVKTQLAEAVAVAEAPVGAVDTNNPNPPKNTTGATAAVEEKKDGGNA